MPPKKTLAPSKPERVIALIAGESGTGKSFFVANLKNALIFDTDVGGGLAYLDARIASNESERVEVASYLDVIGELNKRRGKMGKFTTLAFDHLTTLQQEGVLRWNPDFAEDTFGREHDRANKEWRKIREMVRYGDYHLVCTAHVKNKYEKKKVVGLTTDAAKNVEADFTMVLYATRSENGYPSTSNVMKWRRDPEDARGLVPSSFPFTMEDFIRIHGFPLVGERQEVPMASEEQIAEVKRLVETVKLPEGTVEAWFTKAKAEDWAEFTAETLGKCIAHLKAKLQPSTTE